MPSASSTGNFAKKNQDLKSKLHQNSLRIPIRLQVGKTSPTTLASGIDVGQGINIGPGKFGKKNKRRAFNTHVLCSK